MNLYKQRAMERLFGDSLKRDADAKSILGKFVGALSECSKKANRCSTGLRQMISKNDFRDMYAFLDEIDDISTELKSIGNNIESAARANELA